MKNKKVILSLAIVLFVSVVSIIMISNSNQTVELTEDQKLFNELSSRHFEKFGVDEYLISGDYISGILPNTNIKDFVKKFPKDVKIYDDKKQVVEGIVKTGMTLQLYDMQFVLLVTGDLDNDGKFTQIDLSRIIRNIGKDDITDVEKKLSDLNGDGLINETDADFGADILLGVKKFELADYSSSINEPYITAPSLGGGWYNGDVQFTMTSSSSYGYEYEVFGTKEIPKTKSAGYTVLMFDKAGAYLVNVYIVNSKGNTVMRSYLIGIDYSRNRCTELGADTLSNCMLINDDVKYTSVENAKSSIKKKSTNLTSIATTDEGLLSVTDKDGDSFYYRGNVNDNFVEFAGYTWRIIRRNGDGSVRLIYNGTTTSTTGTNTQIGTSLFGTGSFNFNKIGYKRNENLKFIQIDGIHEFSFNTYSSYTFADSYTCDDETKICSLSGNKVVGKFAEIYNVVLNGDAASGGKPYKYFITTSSYINYVSEIVSPVVENGVTSSSLVNVKYFGYLEQESPNTSSSTIKNTIDNWYQTNILNKTDEDGNSWSKYLADNYFCDEKSLSSEFTSGGGFTVYFKGYERISNFKPSYTCENDNNNYTVKNGELIYPIGLITADEVMFAGGGSSKNSSYWLYTGSPYWTMTTNSLMLSAPLFHYVLTSDGTLGVSAVSSTNNGIRPVINLSKDVVITRGVGTSYDPYRVALSK